MTKKRRIINYSRDFSFPESFTTVNSSESFSFVLSAFSKDEKYLDPDVDVWDQKLNNSDLDSKSIKNIKDLENFLATQEKRIKKALKEVIYEMSNKKGSSLTEEEIQHLVNHANKKLEEVSISAFNSFLPSIKRNSENDAEERIPGRDTIESGVVDWIKDSIGKALTKVKTLVKKDQERVRDTLDKGTGFNKRVRDILKEKEKGVIDKGLSHEDTSRLVDDVWKGAGNLKRVVRTETVEVYVRSQLEQWKNMGVKKVRWRIIRDGKACPLCQNLDGRIFKIDDLLKEKYIHTHSHPNSLLKGIPILMEDNDTKPVEDIRLFDKVKLPEGDFMSKGSSPHPFEGNIVKLNDLEATDYHKVYFVREGKVYLGRMDEVREGDFLLKRKI